MKLSEWYWTLYGVLSYDILLLFLPYQEMLDRMISVAKLESGMRILDAGSGTGNLINKITKNHLGLSVIGIDFTKALIAISRLKCRKSNVRFKHLDLNEKLPFDDKEFDRIFCSNVLYTLDNPVNVIREFYRILSEDGRLIIVNPRKDYRENAPFNDHMKRANIPLRMVVILFTPILLALKVFNVINRKNQAWHYYDIQNFSDLFVENGFKVDLVENIYSGIGTLLLASKGCDSQ